MWDWRHYTAVTVGIILAVVGLIFGLVLLSSFGSTTADTVGLHYNGGTFEGQSFERMIEPGSGAVFLGPGDSLIRIPINKRDYTFCSAVREDPGDDGCDGGPIFVTARGGAEIAFSGGLSFVINTGTEDAVRSFNELLCRKFECAGDGGLRSDGWAELLRVNVRAPFEDTLQEIVREYTVDEVYAGVPSEGSDESASQALSTLTRITDAAEEQLRDTLNEFAGGTFFCGPSFSRAEPENCPRLELVITEVTVDEATEAAFEANVASRQNVITARNEAEAAGIEQEQRNENTVSQARAQAEAAASLSGVSDPAYVAYLQAHAMELCAANPECTLIVTPPGVNIEDVTDGNPG